MAHHLVPIYFDRGTPVYSNAQLIGHYFPALLHEAEHRGHIDTCYLVDNVSSVLRGSFGIRPKSIQAALKTLFGHIQYYSDGSSMHWRTIDLLRKFTDQDVDHPSHSGLYRARTRFLVLAFVAHRTKSHQLANTLVTFFHECTQDIMAYETSERLSEWGAGIIELRNMITEHQFHECMYLLAKKGHKMATAYRNSGLHNPQKEQLMSLLAELLEWGTLYDFDRGRRNHRHLMWEPRSATIPRMHQHRRVSRSRTPLYLPAADNMLMHGLDPTIGMLAPPGIISPGILTPMGSPMGSPFGAPADDVDILAMRQDDLEDQVRQLQAINGVIPMI